MFIVEDLKDFANLTVWDEEKYSCYVEIVVRKVDNEDIMLHRSFQQ